jgi:hypothetical protein
MFRNLPLLEYLGPRKFKVCRPLTWATRDDLADAITVPEGFVTDLASFPNFLRDREEFDAIGASVPSAILHDFLYASGKFGKAFADEVFYHALRSCGVGKFTAWLMYMGVKLGGGGPYREHARRRELAEKAIL